MVPEVLVSLGIVGTYLGHVWFALVYVPERPPSQGWEE